MANQIGKKIRTIRQSRHLTLSELAIRSGIAKSYVSYIERNPSANPSVDVLARICNALGVEVDAVLNSKRTHAFDAEWLGLIHQAQSSGITAQDFLQFIKEHPKY